MSINIYKQIIIFTTMMSKLNPLTWIREKRLKSMYSLLASSWRSLCKEKLPAYVGLRNSCLHLFTNLHLHRDDNSTPTMFSKTCTLKSVFKSLYFQAHKLLLCK